MQITTVQIFPLVSVRISAYRHLEACCLNWVKPAKAGNNFKDSKKKNDSDNTAGTTACELTTLVQQAKLAAASSLFLAGPFDQ